MKLARLSPLVPKLDLSVARPLEKIPDAHYGTQSHKRWRTEVYERAGFQCEWVDGSGRCPVRSPAKLYADHIQEREDGGADLDLANGQCLCAVHHGLKTQEAKRRRQAFPS